MTTGIAVALAIICSQLLYSIPVPFQKKETKTEQHQQEDSEDQVYFSVPSTSMPSSSNTELNPNVFFLFDILLDEFNPEVPALVLAIPRSEFFRTIFGLFISPNAP